MSSLKTLITALIMVTATGPVHASGNIAWTFASCAGRLSAQMEYEWLINDPASEATAVARATMLTLLETVAPSDADGQVLAWRIDAKHAQAVLLTRSRFNDDPDDAAWAKRRAMTEIAHCSGLLLS